MVQLNSFNILGSNFSQEKPKHFFSPNSLDSKHFILYKFWTFTLSYRCLKHNSDFEQFFASYIYLSAYAHMLRYYFPIQIYLFIFENDTDSPNASQNRFTK